MNDYPEPYGEPEKWALMLKACAERHGLTGMELNMLMHDRTLDPAILADLKGVVVQGLMHGHLVEAREWSDAMTAKALL